jgi:hypothetical protein
METWLSASGLVCGSVGALLIYRFGVPHYPERRRAGQSALLLESHDSAEVGRVKWAVRLAKSGAILIAASFAFQLAGLLLGN